MLSAQSLIVSGKIVNSDQHPIPFASLGIKGKSIGTIANEHSAFRFTITPENLNLQDQLIVSSIGYAEATIPLADFKDNTSRTIILRAATTELEMVSIKATKPKTKIVGRTSSSTFMAANLYTESNLIDDNLGKEQATIIKMDDYCHLKDFNMLVAFNRFERVKFRLNFYDVKDGMPNKRIVNKEILFDVTAERGWVTVDLKPYNIYLKGHKKIAVAIQWIQSVADDSEAKAFGISIAPIPLHAVFTRDKSQSEWIKKSPAFLGFNITVDSYHKDKDQTETEAVFQLNDSIKNIVDMANYSMEAETSGYGSNREKGKTIPLKDATLYYETYGSGTPLLLLHGNGQSIAAFYKQIPELSKHHQVIAMDTRAQGKSTDTSSSPLSYELFAEDVKTLMDSLHLKSANIVGWSDGGNTGLIMALRYPGYVTKLVTMGANLNPEGVAPQLMKRLHSESATLQGRTDAKSIQQQRLLQLLLKEPNIPAQNLNTITIPVLVLAGEDDVILKEHTQEIARNIPKSSILLLENATHYAPQEQPEAFNSNVLSFLKNK